MTAQTIVITGGPSTGKTSLIDRLKHSGHCCYSEISRILIQQAQKKGIEQPFLADPLLFSQKVLDGRIQQFKSAIQGAHDLVFVDRGIPDVLAYMDYANMPVPDHFVRACLDHRYRLVFLLPPWPEIHTNDKERYENFEQTIQIDFHLKKTYEKYGYHCISVPFGTLETRILFIKNQLKPIINNGATH